MEGVVVSFSAIYKDCIYGQKVDIQMSGMDLIRVQVEGGDFIPCDILHHHISKAISGLIQRGETNITKAMVKKELRRPGLHSLHWHTPHFEWHYPLVPGGTLEYPSFQNGKFGQAFT